MKIQNDAHIFISSKLHPSLIVRIQYDFVPNVSYMKKEISEIMQKLYTDGRVGLKIYQIAQSRMVMLLISIIGWTQYMMTEKEKYKEWILNQFQESIEIQSRNGNWNYDAYMHGMLNGMIYMESIISGTNPEYKDSPEEYILDREIIRKLLDK